MATESDRDLPAILGGDPLLAAKPAGRWVNDADIATTLQQIAADGSWAEYMGRHGRLLVERLKADHGCEHVLLCSSGRTAVELALRGLSVGTGDDVALAAYDFHSNFESIHQVGATPLLVDTRAEDAQLDVNKLADAIGPVTRAVVASHLHGGVVDMPALRTLADEREVAVIEDACQASGATIYGRPAGGWGDVGILSFGGSKLVSAGRGGALLTNRDDVMQRLRRYLRGDNHSYPLSEMQAAVLLPQLQQLPGFHRRRSDVVARIIEAAAEIEGLRLFETPGSQSSPAFYKLGLFYNSEAFEGLSRLHFCEALQFEGLEVNPGFPALQTIHSLRRFRAADRLTCASEAGETVVGLHHTSLLMQGIDWSELTRVIRRIQKHATQIGEISNSERRRTPQSG